MFENKILAFALQQCTQSINRIRSRTRQILHIHFKIKTKSNQSVVDILMHMSV